MRIMKVFSVLAVLAMAGCSSGAESGKPLPNMTFQHIKPISLPVSEVLVEDLSTADSIARTHSFTVPYETVLQNYVQRKFNAVGGNKVLRVVVEQISVNESFEESKNRVAGFLDVAGFEVYDVKLGLNIAARDAYGAEKGVRLKAERKIKVSEHASVAERERLQMEGLEVMFRELDASITRIVFQDLGLVSMPGVSDYQAPLSQPPSYGDAPVPLYDQQQHDPQWGQEPYGGSPSGASSGVIERQEL